MKSKPSQRNTTTFAATLLPGACVKDVLVSSAVQIKDQFAFSLQIIGRTRFMPAAERDKKCVRYTKVASYNVLSALNKALEAELSPYLRAAGKPMPAFPGSSWLSGARRLAEKRVVLFNKYFAELFDEYGEVLLYSPTMANFFEPTKMDLRVVGSVGDAGREFVRSLGLLASSLEIVKRNAHDVCELGIRGSVPELLARLKSQAGWESCFPFDLPHKQQLFRVDVQNLYSGETSSRDEWLNLYQTPNTVCVIAFSIARRGSYLSVKELLGNLKLLLLEGRSPVPPFVVVGLEQENPRREVTHGEVTAYMKALFGDECPHRYLEVSTATGHNVLESVQELAEATAALDSK